MYNRYIPQPDGTYQRRHIPDPPKPAPPPKPCPAEKPAPAPPTSAPPRPSAPPPRPRPQHSPPPKPCSKNDGSVSSFLKQLLPKGFDTGDLLVVVLLLLMAGDCQEDQNTALLTLALYLFL